MLAGGREPLAKQLRLAWWREALERLDREAAPPEPVLQALAAHVVPAGVSGAELAAMADGWEILLGEAKLDLYAEARGATLFRLSARLLGEPDFPVDAAGRRWALVDLARHSSSPADAETARQLAGREAASGKWPKRLRPLGMLSALARRDLDRRSGTWERPGAPGRMLRMLRHRLTGI